MTTIKMYAKSLGVPEEAAALPFFVNSLNGALAGAISGFLTNPQDVIKTRQMTF
jgi:hypothetical protein